MWQNHFQYVILNISYHPTLEKEMSVLHFRTICHRVHYIVRTDIVRTSVRTTHNRTYLFLSYTFFSAIKNVVSSISTGVPLKIFQPSLSHTTKPIFLRFFLLQFIYSRWVMGKRKPNYCGVLGWTSLYTFMFHVMSFHVVSQLRCLFHAIL